jgi:hypothetical protein
VVIKSYTQWFHLTIEGRRSMISTTMRAPPRSIVIAVLAFGAVACGDSTGALRLTNLCPQATWAGIQREGESWQSIPATRSAVPLRTGERIGLARIRGDSLQIFYVTAEQAEAGFTCEAPPTKELHGTVQGIGGAFTSTATIVMGNSVAFAAARGLEDFTLSRAPNGPADLVATAFDVGPKTIIRHGVDYPDGSTMPVLDFSSSEGFALQTNTVSVTGTNNADWSATSGVVTQRGTQGILRYSSTNTGTSLPMYSVPESRLVAGELNSLSVTGALARVATVFYRAPSDRTVQLGPPSSPPVITRTGTSPNQTLHVDVASQPEYGTQITLILCTPAPLAVDITIIATKEYFGGTPATWSFDVPDLLSVPGYPSFWPDPRESGVCGLIVTDRPYLASPHDGDTFRSAQG